MALMILAYAITGILVVIALWSIGELIRDAHLNGEQAAEATERAGRVEMRDE